MTRREQGFTLIELMITLVVLLVVMSAISVFFPAVVRQFKQQSKLAETGVESIVGLEILRRDLESAGFGLPWNGLPAYNEAGAAPGNVLNDASGTAPRGIVSIDNATSGGPDYLAVKSTAVGTADACRKWTTLQAGPVTRAWSDPLDNLQVQDRVLVLSPGSTNTNWRTYVGMTTFAAVGALAPGAAETRLVYGLGDASTIPVLPPARPFNRADYYVDRSSVPRHCAPNTGVLVKSVLNQNDQSFGPPLPLLDCVAGFEVVYLRDLDGDGTIDAAGTTGDITGLTAAQIRDQVKMVRVDILAQEGQRDDSYSHSPTVIYVGDPALGGGDNVDIGPYRNYRWRLHTIVVAPPNLRN